MVKRIYFLIVRALRRISGAAATSLFTGVLAWGLAAAPDAAGQAITLGQEVFPVDIGIGRSIPMTTRVAIQRVSVANPDVADIVVVAERELVVNALDTGVTDVIVWLTDGQKFQYRINVHSPIDRKQVLLQVRIGEADRDLLREIGFSFLFQDQHTRAGTGAFATRSPFDTAGNITLLDKGQFATILSVEEVKNLTGLLDLSEQSGRFRILAEPNLIAANGEEASFLAGGELPIPVTQTSAVSGVPTVTIEYREFGVRLNFKPEILSEELLKLTIEPEISNLDFSNAIAISGFLVPALRTRKTSTTLDMVEGQTLAIAGLLNFSEETVDVGVPLLKDIPILGYLFSSKRLEQSETELLFLVTPLIIDPMAAPAPPPLPGEDASDDRDGADDGADDERDADVDGA